MNTIDESVWETLKRDLLAVWEKMRQVLYPKYLFGGLMQQGGGIGGAERGEGAGLAGGVERLRGLVGRWPDADIVLQGGMSEGLRDWDLWYGLVTLLELGTIANCIQGPTSLLPPPLPPPLSKRQRKAARARFQWRLRHHLGC